MENAEIFTSSYDWLVEDAISWSYKAMDDQEFIVKSEKIAFIDFPMRWRIEIINDENTEDPGLKFKIRMVQNKGTTADSIENAMFQIKAEIKRGSNRVNWYYFQSGVMELLADEYNHVEYDQFIGKLRNLSAFVDENFCFNIEVEVKIFQQKPQQKKKELLKPIDFKKSLSGSLEYLEKLLVTGEHSDILIRCGNENSYKLHKAILGSRSKVLNKIFEDIPDLKEFDISSKDEQLNHDSLQAFFKFIYTAKWTTQSLEIAKSLMLIAHNFKIDGLKEVVEQMLETYVNQKNSLEMLKFAVRYESTYGLKETAFTALKDRYQKIGIDVPIEYMENPLDLTIYLADVMVNMVSEIHENFNRF